MLPALMLLFAVRFDPADPNHLAVLRDLAVAAPPAPQPQPPPPPPRGWPRPPPRWGESARSLALPPPISSLRPLVRTRTADGRLVIAAAGRGGPGLGLVCTRRREEDGDGEGRLTMRLRLAPGSSSA